jgi:hypothetical protein
MRKRLYLIVPTVQSCQRIIADLCVNNVAENDIHVLAREDIPLEGLNQATTVQRTELIHGVEMGLSVGGVAGMLGGLMAVTFPPAGLVIGGGALLVLATTLVGAGFGSLVSVLVASDIPNHELEVFQESISRGEILLIVDVASDAIESSAKLIKYHHPEARISIVVPSAKNVPKLSTKISP